MGHNRVEYAGMPVDGAEPAEDLGAMAALGTSSGRVGFDFNSNFNSSSVSLKRPVWRKHLRMSRW
jgi:hypothetical protein